MIRLRSALPALLLAVAACGGGSDRAAAPSPTPCTGLPTADPAASMPPGLPPVDGQVLYAPETQGKTEIVYGLLAATTSRASFVKVRDDYVTKLKAAGWTIDGTDQESVEAEAQFSKSPPLQTGTIKVTPASCAGYVAVRYKVNL